MPTLWPKTWSTRGPRPTNGYAAVRLVRFKSKGFRVTGASKSFRYRRRTTRLQFDEFTNADGSIQPGLCFFNFGRTAGSFGSLTSGRVGTSYGGASTSRREVLIGPVARIPALWWDSGFFPRNLLDDSRDWPVGHQPHDRHGDVERDGRPGLDERKADGHQVGGGGEPTLRSLPMATASAVSGGCKRAGPGEVGSPRQPKAAGPARRRPLAHVPGCSPTTRLPPVSATARREGHVRPENPAIDSLTTCIRWW